jgi:hypothetical protein
MSAFGGKADITASDRHVCIAGLHRTHISRAQIDASLTWADVHDLVALERNANGRVVSCSDAAYCVPQVVQIQAPFHGAPFGASSAKSRRAAIRRMFDMDQCQSSPSK